MVEDDDGVGFGILVFDEEWCVVVCGYILVCYGCGGSDGWGGCGWGLDGEVVDNEGGGESEVGEGVYVGFCVDRGELFCDGMNFVVSIGIRNVIKYV